VLAKTLILSLIAAFGVPSSAQNPDDPDAPDEVQPPEGTEDGQHFCCTSIDTKTSSGDGCTMLASEHIVLCNNVLYCNGSYAKVEGKVTCLPEC
jgi:hypothetical protein